MWNQAFVILALPDSWLSYRPLWTASSCLCPKLSFLVVSCFELQTPTGLKHHPIPGPCSSWTRGSNDEKAKFSWRWCHSQIHVFRSGYLNKGLTMPHKKTLYWNRWNGSKLISHWLFSHWLSLGRLVGSGSDENLCGSQLADGDGTEGAGKGKQHPKQFQIGHLFIPWKNMWFRRPWFIELGKRNHMDFEVRPIRAPVTKSICWGLCWKRDACIGLDRSQVSKRMIAVFFWKPIQSS